MCRGRRAGPRTTDTNLDCAFVENALVFVVPKMGVARAPLPLPPFTTPMLVGMFHEMKFGGKNTFYIDSDHTFGNKNQRR